MLELQLLALLLIVNGIPVFTSRLLGQLNRPLDGGLRLADKRHLFGPSKTLGGLVAALLITPLIARVMGFDWEFGIGFTMLAMLGDLISSFIKRRLGMASSSRSYGVDQIPESLLPLLFCSYQIALEGAQILLVMAMFFITVLLLSKLLYRLRIKNRPY